MFIIIFRTLCLIFYAFTACNALECAKCTTITSPTNCTSYTTCNNGERCYTTSFGIGTETTFDLGCKTELECLGGSSSSLVGRSVEQHLCNQCCAQDRCNINSCSVASQVINEVGTCADDPKYDCKQMSSAFNLCSDVHHAKIVCRSYCGLCNLVDGAWSLWSSWSACDVTCGTGSLTRTRTCTDPQPAHGGLSCNGNKTDFKPCVRGPCPIHGGWGSWQSWSSCSHTCSIGTQARHRSCDNPVPQLAGNHCFGDPVDFRSCFLKSCSDGGWSSWSKWTNCSHGMTTRTRVCNNPQPSQFGRDCAGNNEENIACTVNVAFTVTTPNTTLIDGRPIFTNVITNVGAGYDPNAAKFTCPIAGLYQFTSIIAASSRSYSVYCYIQKNGTNIVYASDSNNAVTTSTYLQLDVGDVVNLGNCHGWSYVNPYLGVSFSGALVGT